MLNVLGCAWTCHGKDYFIPQRYIMGLLAWSALIVAYGQRIVLNFAITEIVPRSMVEYIPCRGVRNITESGIMDGGEMNWNRHQVAWVLGSFYFGFILGHIPLGLYVDRYGSRLFFSSGILMSTVMVICQPSIISYLPEYYLMVSRFVMGLSQSAMYPSISVLFARWIPPDERSIMGGFSYSANALGLTIGNLVTGQGIKNLKSWPFPFYFWGTAGILWYMLFMHYVFSEPETHPFITDMEKTYLEERIKQHTKYLKIPWKGIFSDSTIWGLLFAQIGHDHSMYTQLSSLPRFLAIVAYYDVHMTSIMTSLPYMFQWITGMGTGKLVNYLIRKKHADVATCRRTCTTLGLLFPAIVMFFVPYKIRCNRIILDFVLCLYCLFKGPISVGLQVNHLDMTRNFAGIVSALVNGVGGIMGLTPIFISWVVIDNTWGEWCQYYGLVLGFSIIGNIVYLFSCTGERRPWDLSPVEVEAAKQGWTKS